ncbi:MAG: type II secretion system protein [Proteobacteria bacterium]|nr:type II secretion system protein [Pseudomonadota bacterium]
MIRNRKKSKSFPNQGGFSLVELSIVIIVSGIVTLLISSFLTMYKGQNELVKTAESIEMAKYATQAYFSVYGRYPCPSDITLPQADPNYGVENRDSATGLCLTTPAFPAVDGRDVNANGGPDDSEKILIGGLPYKSLSGELLGPDIEISKVKQNNILDGWGHQLTYVVTKGMTAAATYDDESGSIEVKDETDRSLLSLSGSAHAAFISHGKNGRGGYDKNGIRAQSCAGVTLPPPPPPLVASPPSELENCDHDDGTLLSGLRSEASYAFNDDIVGFMLLKKSSLWKQAGVLTVPNPGNPGQTIDIPQRVAANKGNVGIGISDPQKELDVMGNLMALEFRTREVCDSTSDNCIPPEYIGGDVPDMTCPSGQVIVSIEGLTVPPGSPSYDSGNPDKKYPKVNCAAVAFTPPPPGSSCAPGRLAGVTSTGGLICR